jgi:hypothetical protein
VHTTDLVEYKPLIHVWIPSTAIIMMRMMMMKLTLGVLDVVVVVVFVVECCD